ncbi:MAG: hypothetical protein JNG85_17885 [Spirochaetaceae bacterium]|nr:hypothetical protein [Spirochaetaceae bacterium]
MTRFDEYLEISFAHDVAVQRALVETEEEELARAFVGLDEASRAIFLRNMSEAGRASLMAALAGPTGAAGAEEAEAARGALAKRLAAAAKLPLPRI